MSNPTVNLELQNMSREAQARNTRRLRMALLIAVLIGALGWKTQWITLQPGLLILLLGQLAFAAFLIVRNRRLAEQVPVDAWFRREISATRQAAWLENGPRMLGFVVLAIGFWRSTGNLLVSVALGLLYPALLSWGLVRVTGRQLAKRFAMQRAHLETIGGQSSQVEI